MLSDISLCNIFLEMSLQIETKTKIIKWDYIKLKSFCTVKGNYQQNEKRLSTEWSRCYINDITDKGLISKIYRLLKINVILCLP